MGDREGFRLETALALYGLIPNSQRAILPHADHFVIWTDPTTCSTRTSSS